MKNENKNAPAFPPQFAQDNFGRIVAPITGMSKLEYFTIQLLPAYLKLSFEGQKFYHDGKEIGACEAVLNKSIQLLETIEKHLDKDKPEEAIITE